MLWVKGWRKSDVGGIRCKVMKEKLIGRNIINKMMKNSNGRIRCKIIKRKKYMKESYEWNYVKKKVM